VPDHDATVVDRYLRAVQAGETMPKGRYDELERQFVSSVRSFSTRNGISFGAWRDVGVAVAVLARAGLSDPEQPASRIQRCTRYSRPPRAVTHGTRTAHSPHPVAGCGDDD
jgi:hypothetical protein